MNKEKFSQNDKTAKILGSKKLTSINGKEVRFIKKKNKNLKINIQNSNSGLTSITNTSPKNNTHSKNFLMLEQFRKSKKFQNKYKYSKAIRSENSKSKNETQKTKRINIELNISNKKLKDNKIKMTPKNNKLIEENSLAKISKLYLPKVLNNINIYKYYSKENIRKMPSTSRNYESSISHKKINNYVVNSNEKILRSQPHIRNINIKSIYNKNENKILRFKKFNTLTQNCINYDTSTDTKSLYNPKNYYQYTDIYQNLSYKLKAKNKEKPLSNKKNKDITDFNNSLTHINEESSRHLNLKNIKNKGSKIINFLDLIKMKKKKVEKTYIYNKSIKADNSIKGNCSEDIVKIKYIKNKTSNNSIRNKDSVSKKNNFRSCDIPLKIKKNKNKLSIIPLIKLINSDKNINHKLLSVSNDRSHIFNGNKNEKKGLIHTGIYMKKETSYDFLESEQELNKDLINEIRINNFDVNKPKEQNMKYTLYKEFKEENENENDSSKPESHASKIIIGKIESYKDIIEKDRINGKNTSNINKDKNELITVPDDDSIESEKFIINMINFGDNENNSSLFSNEFTNNISNEKVIKYNLKNIPFYPNIQCKKKKNNNHLNNNKRDKKKIEKNSENNSNDQFKKRYTKIIKKINRKINKENILYKSNNNIVRNKNMNIPKMNRKIESPLNKIKLAISKDSIRHNKNNLISNFMDENNKKDENCTIF